MRSFKITKHQRVGKRGGGGRGGQGGPRRKTVRVSFVFAFYIWDKVTFPAVSGLWWEIDN